MRPPVGNPVSAIILLVAVCSGCEAPVPPRHSPADDQVTLTKASDSGAWLFGTHADEDGLRAWLFSPADSQLILYDPPGVTLLCASTSDERNHAWRGDIASSVREHVIKRTAAPDGWRVVRQEFSPRRVAADSFDLQVRRIAERSTPSARRDGVYSSLGPHEETGDLLGTELIIASSGDEVIGAVVVGEGSATGPYAMIAPAMRGDTLTFTINSMGADVKYRAVFRANETLLEVPELQISEVLPFRATLGEWLAQHRPPSCSKG